MDVFFGLFLERLFFGLMLFYLALAPSIVLNKLFFPNPAVTSRYLANISWKGYALIVRTGHIEWQLQRAYFMGNLARCSALCEAGMLWTVQWTRGIPRLRSVVLVRVTTVHLCYRLQVTTYDSDIAAKAKAKTLLPTFYLWRNTGSCNIYCVAVAADICAAMPPSLSPFHDTST